MVQTEVIDKLPAADADLGRLVGINPADGPAGAARLNDELLVQFRAGGGPGFVAVLARDDRRLLVGYAQASAVAGGYTIGIVAGEQPPTDPPPTDPLSPIAESLIETLLSAISRAGGGRVTWWVANASAGDEQLAMRFGFSASRQLLEMRRPLPLEQALIDSATPIDTRPYLVGTDEDAWLTVNNRAFDGHHEQGCWTIDMLRARQTEPWFDASDVLLHERDGRLAGFCWTKLHRQLDGTSSAGGEIYVIAVDPDFVGMGLGRALAIAGYRHMTDRGATTALLYVDADNVRAVALYRSLGLVVTRGDIAYTTHLVAS
jgi:mycothiol synthase